MQLRVLVQGRVQGVGFRPSVYRFAKSLDLRGYVRNLGNGNVEILVEGDQGTVREFLSGLEGSLPPLAEILTMETEVLEGKPQGEFRIEPSKSPSGSTSNSYVPQDVATCDRCLEELLNPDNRRHGYPFITCTDCGPRYSISGGPPFDRDRTSMSDFPMCERCRAEYEDPGDRRYHAQTIACRDCGPGVRLIGPQGELMVGKPIIGAAKLLEEGEIVAVKGLGGSHIACLTTDNSAVRRLREILGRPFQPFALMASSIEDVRKFSSVSESEEEMLLSWRRPIVVLDKLDPFPLSPLLSPDLSNIGVMLPYTPLHHLLLSRVDDRALVMTSANVHGEPMILKEGMMREKVGEIGYLLWHDREIRNRVDDSVVRFQGEDPVLIRRSRGYVPHPVSLGWSSEDCILGVGPELNSVACIAKNGLAYLTQHIGNTSNFDTYGYLRDAISSLMKNTSTQDLDAIAHDLHPQFLSTRLAKSMSGKWGCPTYAVQHHYAHLYSLLAEHGLEPTTNALGIICDGVGYGSERESWGGEVLAVGDEELRMGSLQPQPLIGGDLASLYPVRMVVGILAREYREARLKAVVKKYCHEGLRKGEQELDLIIEQLKKRFNVTWTTSTGRVLDVISALLGISYERTYEGEGPMRLEGVASRGDPKSVDLPVDVSKKEGRYVFDTMALVRGVVEALEARRPRKDIAASAQESLAEGIAEMANLCAREMEPDFVGCSGGVMYNRHIVSTIEKKLDHQLVRHTYLPPGDGCICVGQVTAAYRQRSL